MEKCYHHARVDVVAISNAIDEMTELADRGELEATAPLRQRISAMQKRLESAERRCERLSFLRANGAE